ncbi:MAG: peptide transporter [Armatimonadota bacterium]
MSDTSTNPEQNAALPPNDETAERAATLVTDKTPTTDERASSDPELEIYRTLLEPPKDFHNGFTWTAVAGAFFCGLLMMPGTIYLSLMTGGNINAAWVTLIIFSEISRRAMKTLSTQELVVLLYVAGAMSLGGPAMQLIYRQYFVTSDPVRDAGLLGQLPSWWAPQPGSLAILERNLFHSDWLVPILLIAFMSVMGRISSYTLGYFFFRLTSDVERLPFPFAPISAAGAMALAESGEKKTTWKWKVFSIGAMLGLIFAAIQIGVPLVSGALLTKPIQIIPMPWYDSTTLTESFLPATPTGVSLDLVGVLIGMVIPFWAVVGQGAALLLTFILNPMLHQAGILSRWQPGMDTINTTYVNSIDFWMAFGIGVTAAVAAISIFQTVRDIIRKVKEEKRKNKQFSSTTARNEGIWSVPAGRGDFSPWIAIAIYLACSSLVVTLCHQLVPAFPVIFLLFFTFLYTPFITYINARIIGICGQHVDIPLVRQGAFILSGYKGVEIWLAPIPIDNHGTQAQHFRITELTGTNFWSYVKADLLVIPLSFVLSFVFWGFVWHSSAIPSELFPYAQKMWDLQAKNEVLMYSATMKSGGATPLFYQALHPNVPGGGGTVIGGAFGFTILAFILLSTFGVPVMAIYGFIGVVGGMPHMFIPQVIGALLSKFYFQRKFGQQRFLQIAPILVAGYSTGVGLIALIGVAVNLIVKAISSAPF